MLEQSGEIGFKLYQNCFPVKGAMKSIICDIQRNRYEFISNHIYSLIVQDKSFKDSLDTYPLDSEALSLEETMNQLQFLVIHEYGFWCDEKESDNFPAIDVTWQRHGVLSNALIDVSKNSRHNYGSIFTQLGNLQCEALQLRCFHSIEFSELEEIVSLASQSHITYIEILLKISDAYDLTLMISILNRYPEISKVIFHSSSENKVYYRNKLNTTVIYLISNIIESSSHCGFIHQDNFFLTPELFRESQNHNSCLNGKISIDANGEIKNCPAIQKSFGNTDAINFRDIIKKTDFTSIWSISKNQINTCKDCEFRFICVDCRAYTEDPENPYSKPLKCGYNPGSGEWEDWSTNPIKQKAIAHYGM